MNKIFKRSLSVLLAMIMLFSALPPLGGVAAAVEDKADTVTLSNGFVQVTVNKQNGRFMVRTTEGQPLRKGDQNSYLTFAGDDTSFTTFRINGTDYIFGNAYDIDLGNGKTIQSKMGEITTTEDDDKNQELRLPWTLTLPEGRVEITEVVRLVNDNNTKQAGMADIRYEVKNNSTATVTMATRILMDNMIGTNDGPSYQNGTIQENVQTVERTLVRDLKVGDVVDGIKITDENYNYYNLASYYMMRDYGSYLDALSTNVYAYGFLNIAATNEDPNLVDKVVVGHWNHLANSKFDVEVNPNLDFTEDTNDYGTADTGVAYYWNEASIASGGIKIYKILYGVGEIVNDYHYLDVTFVDQITQLQTNDAQTEYLDDGVFEIIVQVQCPDYLDDLESVPKQHSYITCTLALEDNLDFVVAKNGNPTYDANGNVVVTGERTQYKTYTKSVTDLNAEGPNYFGPGDICTFRFTVKATGKAWPAVREYMVTVTSPELTLFYKKTQESGDTEYELPFTTSYEERRSDYILLPAVGNMVPTSCFSLSPEMAYYTDKKIISVGINNFGAYYLGNEDNDPNFRMFLKNTATNDRYEVNLQRDVTTVDRDGVTGLLRVGYMGGIRVNDEYLPVENDGVTLIQLPEDSKEKAQKIKELQAAAKNPTLPEGFYNIEVMFLGTAEMNKEEVEMLCFETEQMIEVSTDPRARCRVGGFMTITRRYVSLNNKEYERYKMYVDGLNKAGKRFDGDSTWQYEYQTSSSHYFPYYEVKLFETEQEMLEYEATLNQFTDYANKPDWNTGTEWNYDEVLLEIKGQITEQDGIYTISGSSDVTFNGVATYKESWRSYGYIMKKVAAKDITVQVNSFGSAFWSKGEQYLTELGYTYQYSDKNYKNDGTYALKGNSGYYEASLTDSQWGGRNRAIWSLYNGYVSQNGEIINGVYEEDPYGLGTKDIRMDIVTVHCDGGMFTSSGYCFYAGEFTLDFYNGFAKTLGMLDDLTDASAPTGSDVEHDTENRTLSEQARGVDADANEYNIDSLTPRGSYYTYTKGNTYDQKNPLSIIAEPDVYINIKSLYSPEQIGGANALMEFTLNQFRFFTSDDGVKLLNCSGVMDFFFLNGNINNLLYDAKDFYGLDASIGWDLWQDIGLLKKVSTLLEPNENAKNHGSSAHKPLEAGIALVARSYRDDVPGHQDYYAVSVKVSAPVLGGFGVGIAFKEIGNSGNVCPNDIIFYVRPFTPGLPIAPPLVFIREIRGAIRNLADMINAIKNGEGCFSVPLKLCAGLTIEIETPGFPYLEGNVDAVISTCGFKVSGDLGLGFYVYTLALISYAEVSMYWMPSFYMGAEILCDIGNFGIVVGEGHLYINIPYDDIRDTSFDGFISAAVKIPDAVPVVGGIVLCKAAFGVGTERITATLPLGIGMFVINLTVTYYWGDGVEISIDSEGDQEGDSMYYLLYTDEETGTQQLVGFGSNMKVLSTSYQKDPEQFGDEELVHRSLEGGVQLLEYRSNLVGMGGIEVTQDPQSGKWIHTVDVSDFQNAKSAVAGDEAADAMIQFEYFDDLKPGMTVTGITNDNREITYELVPVDLEADNSKTEIGANQIGVLYQERVIDDTVEHLGFLSIVNDRFHGADALKALKITSDQQIDTTLISMSKTAEMDKVYTKQEGNKLTLTAETKYAKPGDVVTFYLTEDAYEPSEAQIVKEGEAIENDETGDMGIMIGQYTLTDNDFDGFDGTVNLTIDNIKDCTIIGVERTDLNTILNSGDYYVVAKLRSGYNDVMRLSRDETTKQPKVLKLLDPWAPEEPSNVTMEIAGNGFFSWNFQLGEADKAAYPEDPKDGQVVTFEGINNANAVLVDYYDETGEVCDDYCEVVVNKDTMTYDAETGLYYNDSRDLTYDPETQTYSTKLGGLYEMTSTVQNDDGTTEQQVTVVGLETDRYYRASIRSEYAVTEFNESLGTDYTRYHGSPAVFAKNISEDLKKDAKGNECQLLPTPQYVECLEINGEALNGEQFFDTISNKETPELEIVVDRDCDIKITSGDDVILQQKDVKANTPTKLVLEALTNIQAKKSLTITMTNRKTKDTSSVTASVTTDTVAPTLYLDGPVPGDLTENGSIRVYGSTDSAANTVTVYVDDSTEGVVLNVGKDATFTGIVPVNTSAPKADLHIFAQDRAGNVTEAVVQVNNGSYEVIQSIVTRSVKLSDPYYTTTLETVARIATGKDAEGNVLYKEVLLSNEDVNYSIYKGTNVTLGEDGTIEATRAGSTIVKASLTTADGRALSTSTVVTCPSYDESKKQDNPTPTPTPSPSPSTSPSPSPSSKPDDHSGDSGNTGGDSGNTGTGGSTGDNGNTGGSTGEKDGTVSKDESKTTINKEAVEITIEDGIVSIDATGTENTQNVASKQNAEGFEISYTPGTDLTVDTPLFKAELPAEVLGKGGTVSVTEVERAVPANGQLLNAVRVNLGDAGNLSEPVIMSIAIPDTVAISDVTAVVLRDKDGNVTPLPFMLNMIGDKAYLDVKVTDEGTILFEKCETKFKDVSTSAWSYDDIMTAASREVIQGVGNNAFQPEESITRSAFATILVRTAGLMTQDSSVALKDVKPGAWDYNALAIAREIGVMTGDENGNMNGSAFVTRQEAMAMVGRLMRYLGIGGELSDYEVNKLIASFEDGEQLAAWAREDAALCIHCGIIRGSGNRLEGGSNLSREQCAAIANRAYKLIVDNMK